MTEFIFHGINLFLLLAILVIVSRKKIKRSYETQHEEFKAKLKQASAQYEETKLAYEALKRELSGLESRMAEMRQSSIREIENETQRMGAEADREIEMTIQEGEKKIQAEGAKIKSSLEMELLESSLVLAKRALQKDLAGKDSEWISQMAGPDSGATTGEKNYAS